MNPCNIHKLLGCLQIEYAKLLPSGASEKRMPGFSGESGRKLLSSCLMPCTFPVPMSSENSQNVRASRRIPYAVLLSLENPRFAALIVPRSRWSLPLGEIKCHAKLLSE